SVAGPPLGAVRSCPTRAEDVAALRAGQPAASNRRLGAAPRTAARVELKPARLKKNGSLRSPANTRKRLFEEEMPLRPLAFPVTYSSSPAQHCTRCDTSNWQMMSSSFAAAP